MAPHITLRILGKSVNYTQPNDVLWFLTMNQTKVSPDLASRGMPIRLYYEGDPAQRVFAGPNPLEFAIKYRAQILGELFGMVEHWKSLGRPLGSRPHRCEYWAQMIGGILEACGFPEFLDNAAEAAAEFNTELGDLAAVAEWAVKAKDPAAMRWANEHAKNGQALGLRAAEWLTIFRSAKVESERLEAAKSARSRDTIIGNFLARMIGRKVPIEVSGQTAQATLKSLTGRAKAKLYFFDVALDDPEEGAEAKVAPEGEKTKAEHPRKTAEKPSANPIDRSPAKGMPPQGNDEEW
jgi:hypothetical protein